MTGRPVLKRIELVANTASGGVGPDAPDAAREILAAHGVDARVQSPQDGDLMACLRRAVDARPDLVVILAGDGTARAAAELCGPKGPLLAPLPGGTMNMLPRAIYGTLSWQDALQAILTDGEVRSLGGGEVDGRLFLIAAILGSPALWAPAREAVRQGRFDLAWARAQRALRRAFSGRLRYALDDRSRGKAEAIAFLCPVGSSALADEDQMLEAAALDPAGAAEAFRLGVNAMMGDWRRDPAAQTSPCRAGAVWAAQGLPALLDGEPVRLPARVRITWRPDVVRVLAPRTVS
ncbi:diacylglycerol/lipid kinase family protein [Phenylobacterium aquaticum]|uniref:diacylglycerol/lipid kinase family protein n=1 Tax=Phenylobacterium aquaticum TaxID=1763816 RepID=UPI001F5CBCD7|nr:diacylglycerol kinase family protein [Phenylobacterium aquaticum]MCI3133255.1 diacylglycerol kinase family lipid kinase [Phenylobacterium aquaticum]